MASFEYTRGSHTCDTCKNPSTGGFFELFNETPVLFDCSMCAERNIPPIQRSMALDAYIAGVYGRVEAK